MRLKKADRNTAGFTPTASFTPSQTPTRLNSNSNMSGYYPQANSFVMPQKDNYMNYNPMQTYDYQQPQAMYGVASGYPQMMGMQGQVYAPYNPPLVSGMMPVNLMGMPGVGVPMSPHHNNMPAPGAPFDPPRDR